MKTPNTKLAKTSEAPVFQIAIRKRGPKTKALGANAKAPKRENIFSKSRDTREDRGARQAKTTRNPQTLSRGR